LGITIDVELDVELGFDLGLRHFQRDLNEVAAKAPVAIRLPRIEKVN